MYKTIFIHGTAPIAPALRIPAVHKFIYCPLGLSQACVLDKQYYLSTVADILIKKDPRRFSLDSFYFYGWPGDLDNKLRMQEAEKLYYKLKEFGSDPIRLLTFSHGGNLALNLARVADLNHDEQFYIDELILLACPVQRITKDLVQHRIFRNIYSIHSHADLIQVLDPQGWHDLVDIYQNAGIKEMLTSIYRVTPFFSERHFQSTDHLIQAAVKLKKRSLAHIEFILPAFLQKLPLVLDRLEQDQGLKSKGPDILLEL